MPEEVVFMEKHEILTFEEIARFVKIVVPHGIDKIRLTRAANRCSAGICPGWWKCCARFPVIKDVGLTTNGILLANFAQRLFDAGLRRINVSLDTLDPDRFRQVSRRDGGRASWTGSWPARRAGFAPVKVNAVCMRGSTDQDIIPLARFAREQGVEMRFIEYMPIGADHWERSKVYFAHEIIEQIERGIGPLVPARDYDPRAPAMEFEYADGGGRVGIIASISRPFCRSCNRVRLTAEGKLRNCLFALEEVDLKPLLRGAAPAEAIAALVRRNVWEKWEGHEINTSRFVKPARTMHTIGRMRFSLFIG